MHRVGIGVVIGFIIAWAVFIATYLLVPNEPAVECHTFAVGSSEQIGIIYIGEVELCGENIQWGNVHGPIGRGSLQ